MSTQDSIAVVLRHIEELVNQRHYERVPEIWAPDMAWRGGSMGELRSVADFENVRLDGAAPIRRGGYSPQPTQPRRDETGLRQWE